MLFIDISEFFDFEAADVHITHNGEDYYDVLLTSKSTGEIMTFTFDRAHFDKLLIQMTLDVKAKEDVYNDYVRYNHER